MEKETKELKIKREYFEAVVSEGKTFEVRYNDRDFHVGDILVLREYEGNYTGRVAVVGVEYILDDFEGLVDGYVVMSIKLIWESSSCNITY